MRIFIVILIALSLLVILFMGTIAFRGHFASFFGRMQAEVDIESANSRIANYNMFFNRCAAVQGYEEQITVLDEQLEQTPTADTDERNRLRQSIAGLRGQRARAVARYNADATKDYTAARFQDSDLPFQLSTEGNTVCAAR